ncbi:MAG TPA: nitrogen fixation protein FixH [Aquabacterium sp.]|nr:nitrogen fixation protein FixH [Aquabacterium sp.]
MSNTNQTPQAGVTGQQVNPPWYRLPIVWMVIGGPAAVVVASLFTVGLAVKHVDPVLEVSKSQNEPSSLTPAIQGRNQAAEKAMQPADH